ncbi:hypothetical protein PGTUg99_016745 [Puccinia graminis f. sp. tritici]|uniref:Uncharacterized protein n=1 Tax=Puccinia graminis f. sp. tritici TaxID=56615 RepID=A0A5B0QL32_PUCGR|nr:hypothetical protein PGTUg99_016745 [Puccinia graminis f. sp. tritici]
MSESAASCDLPLRFDIFSWTLPNSITELSSLLTTAHDGSGHPYLIANYSSSGLDPDACGTALSRLTHHLQPKSLVSDQHPVDWVSLPRKTE